MAAPKAQVVRMAFDGVHFEPPKPSPPKSRRGETWLCALIIALAVCALVLPISAAALNDLAAYLLAQAHPSH